MWSFVGSKREVCWVWVALDADTRQVVAMVAGDRSAFTAGCLWDALPDEYREGATAGTDFLASYRAVVLEDQHALAGQEEGLTNHFERFWLTVRHRLARVVRKTLAFSKCPENHVGAS